MTLPDFLVVGAQRAGTTWLDARLRTHPEIYLPERRKEVHFFDLYFDRGVEWYEDFFPGPGDSATYRAIGEVTPKYLYAPEAPERIRSVLPECRIVAVLRDPVERAYSQYGLSIRDHGERRSFERYLWEESDVFERGLYGRQLERYLERFPRERLHVDLFERMVAEEGVFLDELCGFLGVAPEALPRDEAAEAEAVNISYRPAFPRARALVRRIGVWLRRHDEDWIVEHAKRLGVNRLFGRREGLQPMSPETRRELRRRYEPDLRRLQRILDVDLTRWWDLEAT